MTALFDIHHFSLAVAALLSFLICLAHSGLGQVLLLGPLLRSPHLPPTLGSVRFTRSTLFVAWHVPTVLLAAVGLILWQHALLVELSWSQVVTLRIFAGTFFIGFAAVLVVTRGKHLSWVGFLAIALLVWQGSG